MLLTFTRQKRDFRLILDSKWERGDTFKPFHLILLCLLLLNFVLVSSPISVTIGRNVLKFGNMVDMDVRLYKRVSKLKIADAKAGRRRAQNCPHSVRNISH